MKMNEQKIFLFSSHKKKLLTSQNMWEEFRSWKHVGVYLFLSQTPFMSKFCWFVSSCRQFALSAADDSLQIGLLLMLAWKNEKFTVYRFVLEWNQENAKLSICSTCKNLSLASVFFPSMRAVTYFNMHTICFRDRWRVNENERNSRLKDKNCLEKETKLCAIKFLWLMFLFSFDEIFTFWHLARVIEEKFEYFSRISLTQMKKKFVAAHFIDIYSLYIMFTCLLVVYISHQIALSWLSLDSCFIYTRIYFIILYYFSCLWWWWWWKNLPMGFVCLKSLIFIIFLCFLRELFIFLFFTHIRRLQQFVRS